MRIESPEKVKLYYQALLARDESFKGLYYVGVKTTGVFCISTCRARKPLFKNVEFFDSAKDLLQHGYRPCKICKPTQSVYFIPDYIEKAFELVKQNPKQKIKDFELRSLNISPEKVRRWFNKNYGFTYQAYQRMLRINVAFQEIQSGKNISDAVYNSGYESLSGFNYAFKRVIGNSPKKGKGKLIKAINIVRLNSPIGPMYACATSNGVCLLEFTDRRMLETEFKDLQMHFNGPIIYGENQHLKQLNRELKEYFQSKRKVFSVALDHPGTDFQILVWEKLKKIKFGITSSYKQIAIELNKPSAIRAIARANGFNRISILVPCHRVLGEDGDLKGYGGGLERKQWLLNHEQN